MHILRALVVVATTLATCASALPSFGFGAGNGCLTKQNAYDIVQAFIELSNGDDFNVTLAKELLTEDVTDTSGSVASIINGGGLGPVPIAGPPIFANRSDFIAANAAQASTPYEPLNIYWTCDVITFRFVIGFKPQPVLGITILETVRAPRNCQFPFKIKTVYGELNSWAFLVDLGLYTPMPPPPQNGTTKRDLGDVGMRML